MQKQHTVFWMLTFAYGAGFMLPVLVSEGTFLDGLIYAVLARNMAAGLGSFWAPHYSATYNGPWFEHPPLGVNIESMFYRLLGEGVWVEHVHSLATALVCGWLIVVLWRSLVGEDRQLRRLGWLPVLFWMLNPQVTWSYSNNMLENTMTIFSLASVILILRSCKLDKGWILSLVLGSVAILAAFLTKGVVGLFPLATIFAYQLITRRIGWKRTLGRSLLLVGSLAVLFGLLLLVPAAKLGLSRYYETQFVASMNGSRGGSGNQILYLVKLLNTLLPALAAALLLFLAGWKRGLLSKAPTMLWRSSGIMLLLALAGSVPLVVSPRQSMFYVLSSFPFYALATALPVAMIVSALVEPLRDRTKLLRVWQISMTVLLIGVVGFSMTKIGTYNRSKDMVLDVKVIGSYVRSEVSLDPDEEYVVGLTKTLRRDWGLDVNLTRYHRLCVAREDYSRHFVIGLDSNASELGDDFTLVPLDTRDYRLFVQNPKTD